MISRMLCAVRCAVACVIAYMALPAGATETLKLHTFNPTPKYCLFITVDGMDRDYITSGIMANLAAWAPAGARLPDATNVYPTGTTPNMTSLHTGAWPQTTKIGGNIVFYKDQFRVASGPRTKSATSMAQAFKKAGYSTGGVQQYMLENRGADIYINTRNQNTREITTTALSLLTDVTSVPQLMVVLYQEVDHIGHLHGPDSPQLRAAAEEVDHDIATLVGRYAEMEILQDTLVVISADHGMSRSDNKVDMAQLSKAISGLGLNVEWVLPNKPVLNRQADLFLLEAGNLQGYFNREFTQAEQEHLYSAITQVQGMGLVLDPVTLMRMHCDPSAGDFVVEPAPGWRLRRNPGTHGTNRESFGYQAFFGAGVKPGAIVKNARTIDLMPTVLRAFNIEIPETVDGKALTAGLL